MTRAGKGWEAVSQQLQLQGWSAARQVIVMRREIPPPLGEGLSAQPLLSGMTLEYCGREHYEHDVLVTNRREADLLAVEQMYRDRAGAENPFDELKDQ